MELYKLHIGNCSLGTVDHGNAIACSNNGVGGRHIDGTAATGTHHGNLGEIGVDFLRVGIEYIGTIALNIG